MPHVRLFGPPELIVHGDRAERFRTRKHLALLIYLALEATDRPVQRDRLIELLWPEAPPDRGRHSLAQGLTVLRARLGRDSLGRGGHALRLVCSISTDLDLLDGDDPAPHHLEPPLVGLEHLAGTTFAHWLDSTRERLVRLRADRLHAQLDARRRAGDATRVHEVANRLYVADPLSEAAVQALCEQHLHRGDAPAAARLLRRHLARVEREAGPPVSAGLRRLLQQVETGHLATRRLDRTAPRASRHRPPEAFVGREPDLSRLEALWADAREGRRRTCLVAGAAGIGKSSLLARFATSVAARAAAVCEVSCQEIGRDIPFAAVSDIVMALAEYPAARGTDARWLAEASRIAPGLREVYSGIPDPPPLSGESIRLRLAEAVVRILDAVGEEGPMLLVVDDLMYLDPASRDIIHLLLQRHECSPFLVLASARTADEQGLIRHLHSTGIGIDWDEVISLGALTDEQVDAMLRRLLGEDGPLPAPLVAAIAELAEGNPYLVEMLLSDWRRQGEGSLIEAHVPGREPRLDLPVPSTMQRALERQYTGLGAEEERILSLLAIAGQRLSAREVADLLGQSSTTTDSAALLLLDRGLLRVEAGGLTFKNQLHRTVVYQAMPRESRKFLHAKVGEHLASTSGELSFQRMLTAAHHLSEAGLDLRALDLAIEGAGLAIERGGAAEAERALKRLTSKAGDERRRPAEILRARAMIAVGRNVDALRLVEEIGDRPVPALDTGALSFIRAAALHGARLASDGKIRLAIEDALKHAVENKDNIMVLRTLQLSAEFSSETGQDLADRIGHIRDLVGDEADKEVVALAELARGYCLLISARFVEAQASFSLAGNKFREASWELELRKALN